MGVGVVALVMTQWGCSSPAPDFGRALVALHPDGSVAAGFDGGDSAEDAGEAFPEASAGDAVAKDSGPAPIDASDGSFVDATTEADAGLESDASDAGVDAGQATVGWPSPCESCDLDSPHDCAGIGAPDSGPWIAFTCAMACANPPPTTTVGPSGCSYVGPIGPETFEMCCPSSNPGF